MSNINDKIRQIAKETEPELIHIRRELHQYPELGIDLPMAGVETSITNHFEMLFWRFYVV